MRAPYGFRLVLRGLHELFGRRPLPRRRTLSRDRLPDSHSRLSNASARDPASFYRFRERREENENAMMFAVGRDPPNFSTAPGGGCARTSAAHSVARRALLWYCDADQRASPAPPFTLFGTRAGLRSTCTADGTKNIPGHAQKGPLVVFPVGRAAARNWGNLRRYVQHARHTGRDPSTITTTIIKIIAEGMGRRWKQITRARDVRA